MILTSSVAPRFPTKGVLLFALPYREPKEAGGRNVTNSQLWLANNLSDGQCRCVRFALRARHSSDQRRRREPQSESNITWTGRSGYGYEQGSNPPLRQVLQWFTAVVSPWWGICWNAGLPTQGAQSRPLAGVTITLPEPRKNAERMAAIKKQSATRKTRCWGEAWSMIALSLVAILAALGAQIAMFDGVSPNSLAPVRNDPKNRPVP